MRSRRARRTDAGRARGRLTSPEVRARGESGGEKHTDDSD